MIDARNVIVPSCPPCPCYPCYTHSPYISTILIRLLYSLLTLHHLFSFIYSFIQHYRYYPLMLSSHARICTTLGSFILLLIIASISSIRCFVISPHSLQFNVNNVISRLQIPIIIVIIINIILIIIIITSQCPSLMVMII
jgi:hypothetical protein